MDKLAAMQAFVAIADSGSLTGAAEKLAKSQPTMVRTLANLERELGTRLMRRTTRRIALTDEGRDYLARCRGILADVHEAEEALGNNSSVPVGEVRITAPVTFGQWHVAPALVEFVKQHPQVKVEPVQLDRPVNLVEEGLDLGLRIGPLPDSSMVATPVGRMRRVVVVSPALLEEYGVPENPEALGELPCVHFRGLAASAWRFQRDGKEFSVSVAGPYVSNQAISAVDACVAGLGFGQFLGYQVAPAVRRGDLRTVLSRFERAPVPVSLIYSEARMMSSRLRACLEHLKDELTRALTQLDIEIG